MLACANPFCETPIPKNFLPAAANVLTLGFISYLRQHPQGMCFLSDHKRKKYFWRLTSQDNSRLFGWVGHKDTSPDVLGTPVLSVLFPLSLAPPPCPLCRSCACSEGGGGALILQDPGSELVNDLKRCETLLTGQRSHRDGGYGLHPTNRPTWKSC